MSPQLCSILRHICWRAGKCFASNGSINSAYFGCFPYEAGGKQEANSRENCRAACFHGLFTFFHCTCPCFPDSHFRGGDITSMSPSECGLYSHPNIDICRLLSLHLFFFHISRENGKVWGERQKGEKGLIIRDPHPWGRHCTYANSEQFYR